MPERENSFRPLKINRREHYPDNSSVTRVIRERFTGLDAAKAGGQKLDIPFVEFISIPPISDIGRLSSEHDADLEVQMGIGLGLLKLDVDQAIELIIGLGLLKIGVDQAIELINTFNPPPSKLQAEVPNDSMIPGRFEQVEQSLRVKKAKKEHFRRKVKEN